MKTNVLIICLVVFGSVSAATKHRFNHQDVQKLQQGIEFGEIVEDVINMVFDFFLAPYDPVDDSLIYIDFLGLKASIEYLRVEGFSKVVPEASLNVGLSQAVLKLIVTLPKFSGSVGNWQSNFPILYGNGSAVFFVNSASVSIDLDLDYATGFKPSTVVTNIASANAKITGFQNNEELSQHISDSINNFLNNVVNSSEFHSSLSSGLDAILNLLIRMY